jgi:type VI secretion system protein ImpI
MKIVGSDVKELLAARLEAKRLARSLNQTSMEVIGNNPLKFSPTAQDALKLMFGKPTRSYLSALPALHESFQDLKNHQKDVVSGMQQAVKLLIEDLDPEAIESAIEPGRGLSRFTSSRKSKLWDAFVTRWRLKERQHEDGLLGAFMLYFSQCYDKSRKP